MFEIVGCEAPEIHRDRCRVGYCNPFAVVIEIFHNTVDALYLGALYDRCEVMFGIVLADATAYGAAFRKGVAHAETHHCIFAGRAFGQFGEPFAHYAECVTVVEVVAVEHGKRFVNHAFAHHEGMVGAPWLGASLRTGEAFGQSVEALEHQFARNVAFVFREDNAAEVFLKVFSDYKHEFAEACIYGIVDRVVHYCLAVRAEFVKLFQTAIAASHSCCKEK